MGPQRQREIIVKVAVLLVAALSLLSTGRFVLEPPELIRPVGMTVSEYDHRFEELKKALPQYGVVGYLGAGWSNKYEVPDYYATQYALAPRVVEDSRESDLVVGNFSGPLDPFATTWPDRLTPVRNFGNGVVLFAKRPK